MKSNPSCCAVAAVVQTFLKATLNKSTITDPDAL